MPAMRAAVKLLLSACWLLAPLAAAAWGPTGHRIVGLIAESRLCPDTRRYLEPLLDGATLANAGVWADVIRSDPAWAYTKPWHYINVGDTEDIAVAAREHPPNVLSAIADAERQVADRKLPREVRAQALRFFIHVLADVHQPLHVGRAEDRGGNELEVLIFGRTRRTLHALWDAEFLLDWDALDLEDNAAAIGALALNQAAAWQGREPLQWAEESRAYRPLVYALPAAGPDGRIPLDDRYLVTVRGIAHLRLAQAGIRLAERLNRLGCPTEKAPPGPPTR
jgi:S1/P1 Nuclease